MAIGRVILKSISDSKKLSQIRTDGARLLYTWLLTHLDVNGCYSGDPQVINGKIFTRLNKSNKTIEGYLEDLEQNELLVRYNVNGDTFLNVPDFVEKQPSLNPGREGKTSIPLPTPDLIQTNSGKSHVKLNEIKLNKYNISSDELRLSKLLYEEILKRNPEHKEPNLQKWAYDIDLMIRIDKRDPVIIEKIIIWCQADSFWQNNILSTAKLRTQYDQLLLKMKSIKENIKNNIDKNIKSKAYKCYLSFNRGGCFSNYHKGDETCETCHQERVNWTQ